MGVVRRTWGTPIESHSIDISHLRYHGLIPQCVSGVEICLSAPLRCPQEPSYAVRSRQGPSQTAPEMIPTAAHPHPPTRRSATDRPWDNPMEARDVGGQGGAARGLGYACVRGGGDGCGYPSRTDGQNINLTNLGPPNLVIFRKQHCVHPCTGPGVWPPQPLYLRRRGPYGPGPPASQCRC